MEIVRLLLISSLASIITGQIIRLPASFIPGAISLTDIFVFATDLFFILYMLIVKKSFRLPSKISFFTFLFSLAALSSTILALNFYTPSQILVSSMFLLRFVAYFFILIVAYNIVKKNEIINWVHIVLVMGVIFSFIGFIQLLIFPDLRFLAYYGWDPHQNRIVSSLIDPNFTGGLLTIFLAFSISLYLYFKKKIYLVATSIYFLALMFTFSRSSYLAFLAAMLVIGIVKSPKVIIVAILIFVTFIIASPHARDRIIGAVTLDETSRARVESWQTAFSIFQKNYMFGIGFNTYRYAQVKYGNFTFDNPQGGHSGGGTDSSFLLVAATTGIFGLFFYLLIILSILLTLTKKVKSNYLRLSSFSSLLALIVHSQFVNSFFFPQIMVVFWFFLGLVYAQDN